MVSMRISILAVAMVSVFSMQAATFTIKNLSSSTVDVNPIWKDRCGCYDTLKPGEEKYYGPLGSGFEDVTPIKWVEYLSVSVPGMSSGTQVVKRYTANVKQPGINVLGVFKIYGGGSYHYEFGLNNTGDGVATTE